MNHAASELRAGRTGRAALTRESDGHWQLSGDVVFATVSQLLAAAPENMFHVADAVVDLQHVAHMDSAGLALLLEWLREARRHQSQLNFINIPDAILSYARVCGMEELLADAPAE